MRQRGPELSQPPARAAAIDATKIPGISTGDQTHQKLYSLELLRFLCAFTIVWGHLGAPMKEIAYAGLDTFIVLSVALSTRASMRHPLRPFLIQRVQRILLPWLGWCLFYLALRGALHGPATMFTLTEPLWLLVGPVIHMWFLPFLMISAPLAYSATHLPHGRVFGGLFVVLTVPLACLAYYFEWHKALPVPFVQWSFAVPPLLYAITRASGRSLGPLFILIGVLTGMALAHHQEPALYLLISALLFEGALRIRTVGKWAQILGDSAFGIYLSHPFFVMVWTHWLDFETQKVPLALAVFVSSFLLSLALIGISRLLSKRGKKRRHSPA
ncbi:Surface polysaccharide O-acyltransferase, integral membrane enzyme [Thalassovita litoralis]|uniref:Surface polysaccharide O-acyltransferase, integral membrane enzyme n=1 Tax=Thalassovita litoralis TaxID=1010611 RepID=A0A521ETJ7_9RHOB|nr:Surface polysaccharide O-acyltransferase, integral membrane enzyme [Thalassovita litoralis]